MRQLTEEEIRERIRNYRLLDNEFMLQVFNGRIRETEYMLRILMDDDTLQVKSVHVDSHIGNLKGHAARLDVLAEDGVGRLYDIEVQRKDPPALKKRARYYSSLIDTNALKRSEEYDKLPESYVIFITEHDFFGSGEPLYNIERINLQNEEQFDDGEHILFVNAEYSGDDSIGRLMNDFRVSDPDQMHSRILADTARYYKEEEGYNMLTGEIKDLFDEGRDEGIAEERSRTIVNLLTKLTKDDLLSLGYTESEIEDAVKAN